MAGSSSGENPGRMLPAWTPHGRMTPRTAFPPRLPLPTQRGVSPQAGSCLDCTSRVDKKHIPSRKGTLAAHSACWEDVLEFIGRGSLGL